MTAKHVLPEKDYLERAAALKRLGCFPLGKELKKQTIVAEKQYQKLESNKKEEKIRKCYAMLNVYHSKHFTFYKYHDIILIILLINVLLIQKQII